MKGKEVIKNVTLRRALELLALQLSTLLICTLITYLAAIWIASCGLFNWLGIALAVAGLLSLFVAKFVSEKTREELGME